MFRYFSIKTGFVVSYCRFRSVLERTNFLTSGNVLSLITFQGSFGPVRERYGQAKQTDEREVCLIHRVADVCSYIPHPFSSKRPHPRSFSISVVLSLTFLTLNLLYAVLKLSTRVCFMSLTPCMRLAILWETMKVSPFRFEILYTTGGIRRSRFPDRLKSKTQMRYFEIQFPYISEKFFLRNACSFIDLNFIRTGTGVHSQTSHTIWSR